MPITISNFTQGEPKSDFSIAAQIVLPDSGGQVSVSGQVRAPGQQWVTITGSPVAAPGPPGSGSLFWNIQVDGLTGAASVQQSVGADPPLNSPTSVVIFRQTLVAGESPDLAVDLSSTPDS